VALLGWVGVAWRVDPLAMIETGLWRAASVLAYENATAALLAPLAAVALARAAARPDRVSDRLLATVLIVGVGATQSRAGVAGLAAGLLVVAFCVPLRRVLPVAVPVLAGAGIAVAGVVAVSPVSTHRGPVPAVVALAVGAAVAVVRLRWNRRTAVWVAAGAVVVGVVGTGAVVGRSASAVRDSRLSLDSQDRANEWRATAKVADHHLLTGVGPTHLAVRWVDAQGQVTEAHFAHNEYLQLAAEQGVVAPVLVVAALGVVAWALGRRVVASGRRDWLAAGALGGLGAFAVHSAFDFIWHVPVVPVVVAALCGAALSRAAPPAEGRPQSWD
jgi:O-antigen ligase